MTHDRNQTIRWYLYALLIAASFLLMAGIIRFATARYSEDTIRSAMEKTLSLTLEKGVKIGKRMPIPASGLSYIHSYGLEKGTDGIDRAMLVGITGNEGPFGAVFTCSSAGDVRFRGLVGVSDPRNARRYGISDGVIEKWESRIGDLLRKTGEKE
mgnify:CR=1 FL=1